MQILGIDAGGSGARWLLADGSGRALRHGEQGPLQAAGLDAEGLAERLAGLLGAAGMSEPGVVVAGVAGAGDRGLKAAASEALARGGGRPELRIVTDIETAAGAALADGTGIAVWSGTGSFVAGRGDDGALVRAGGRGSLLGDEGSAYDLVRRAARQALLQLDGVVVGSRALADRLTPALGAPSIARLGAVLQRTEVAAAARLAPLVLELARSGDELAMRAAGESFAALADLVEALAKRVRLVPSATGPVLGGGVLGASAFAQSLLARALAERGFAEPRLCERTPVQGAVRLAQAWLRGEEPLRTWVEHGAA